MYMLYYVKCHDLCYVKYIYIYILHDMLYVCVTLNNFMLDMLNNYRILS